MYYLKSNILKYILIERHWNTRKHNEAGRSFHLYVVSMNATITKEDGYTPLKFISTVAVINVVFQIYVNSFKNPES